MGTLIMLILVVLAVSMKDLITDFIGNCLGFLIECFTALVHCIFSWMISKLPSWYLVGKDMYDNEIVISVLKFGEKYMIRLGIVVLVIIAMWQIFKTFFAFAGLNGEIEEPWKIGLKLFIFATLVMGSYGLCKFIVIGPVDKAIDIVLSIETTVEGGKIKKVINNESNEDKVKRLYVADHISSTFTLWGAGLFQSITKFIVVFYADYKIFKFVLGFLQKYMNMLVYILFSPIAFACGVSRATSNVLKEWIRLFVGNIAVQLFQVVILKVLNAYGSIISASNSYNWSILFVYLAAVMSTDKIESILSELGLSGGIKLDFGIGNNARMIGLKAGAQGVKGAKAVGRMARRT